MIDHVTKARFDVMVTDDGVSFDGLDAAINYAHEHSIATFEIPIDVYAATKRVCTLIYNPTSGWVATGYEDENGVDLVKKHGLEEALGRNG